MHSGRWETRHMSEAAGASKEHSEVTRRLGAVYGVLIVR